MNAHTILINDVSGATQVVKLSTAGSAGKSVKIKVPKGAKIQLIDDETQLAPDNIRVERVGDELHVAFQGSDMVEPDLILEDFYTEGGSLSSLVGQAENGFIYEYIPESGVTGDYIGNIAGQGVTGQVLGGSHVAAYGAIVPAGAATGSAFSPLTALALAGLGGAAVVALMDDGGAAPINFTPPPRAAARHRPRCRHGASGHGVRLRHPGR